jgi:hypothetical protein
MLLKGEENDFLTYDFNHHVLFMNGIVYHMDHNMTFKYVDKEYLAKKLSSLVQVPHPISFSDRFKSNRKIDSWIAKPKLSSRGIDIILSRKTSVIKQELHNFLNYVIQEYINPSLWNGYKYDIRCYFLFINDEIYYHFGYIKVCYEKYDPLSKSLFSHLCNYSIQKRHPKLKKVIIYY